MLPGGSCLRVWRRVPLPSIRVVPGRTTPLRPSGRRVSVIYCSLLGEGVLRGRCERVRAWCATHSCRRPQRRHSAPLEAIYLPAPRVGRLRRRKVACPLGHFPSRAPSNPIPHRQPASGGFPLPAAFVSRRLPVGGSRTGTRGQILLPSRAGGRGHGCLEPSGQKHFHHVIGRNGNPSPAPQGTLPARRDPGCFVVFHAIGAACVGPGTHGTSRASPCPWRSSRTWWAAVRAKGGREERPGQQGGGSGRRYPCRIEAKTRGALPSYKWSWTSNTVATASARRRHRSFIWHWAVLCTVTKWCGAAGSRWHALLCCTWVAPLVHSPACPTRLGPSLTVHSTTCCLIRKAQLRLVLRLLQ
ncbi:hypothetical protein E2C01_048537 [Portunus trituberculatus]|uniref:Uncharacterized protein n=1 Tax=Portunus trituberculatus TaxID=210409 RepID=A0A5B7GBB4_PORTR|nr:hypothetical protein [Portunus trituberculatus]